MPEKWESKLRTLRRMEPTGGLLERATEGPRYTAQGPPLRARLVVGVLAFVVFGAAVASTWIAFRPDPPRRTVVLAPGEIRRSRVGDAPQPITVGEGAAWVVTGIEDLSGVVWRVDAETGEAKRLPNTKGAEEVAVGEGFVWVTSRVVDNSGEASLLKLDPESGETVASIELPPWPFGPMVVAGAVWVPTHEGVAKVDPFEERVTRVIPGDYPVIGSTSGSVWATNDGGRNDLHRIDLETGRVVASLDVPDDPCIFEVSEDAVWAATCRSGGPFGNREELLTKIDAATGNVLFRVPLEVSGDMEVVGHTLWLTYWVTDTPDEIKVKGLDVTNGKPTGEEFTIEAGHLRFDVPSNLGGPLGPFVSADDHSLWISEFYAGEVIRLGLPVQESAPAPDMAPRQTPTSAPMPQTNPSPSPDDGAQRCEFPSFQPTHLPWLKEGEPVPEPEAFSDGDSANLYWSWPGSSTKYVRLARQSITIGGSGPGERVAVEVTGAPFGELYEGEASGDQLIYWNTGGATCSEFVLELSTTGDLSREESKDTITRIAQSFQPKTPPSPSG